MTTEIITGDPPAHPKGLSGPAIYEGVLYGMDAACASWVHQVLGGGLIEVGYRGFGIVPIGLEDGATPPSVSLVGGCYFWGYQDGNERDITVSVAVADELLNDMSRYSKAIRQILDYPFGHLKLPRISCEMAMSNTKGIQSALRLGFTLEGRKSKKMKDGSDSGMFGLLADNAKRAGFWMPYT